MILNIQFEEAANLLWEMFAKLPDEKTREAFASRVDAVASSLFHPISGCDIVRTVRLDSTDSAAIALSDVVPFATGSKTVRSS